MTCVAARSPACTKRFFQPPISEQISGGCGDLCDPPITLTSASTSPKRVAAALCRLKTRDPAVSARKMKQQSLLSLWGAKPKARKATAGGKENASRKQQRVAQQSTPAAAPAPAEPPRAPAEPPAVEPAPAPADPAPAAAPPPQAQPATEQIPAEPPAGARAGSSRRPSSPLQPSRHNHSKRQNR